MAVSLPQPSRSEIDFGEVMTALADPLRRTVVAMLAAMPEGEERNCSSFAFPVAKASLTHHFKVLRESGLISQTDYGNRRASVLRRKDIEALFPGLLALVTRDAKHQSASERGTRKKRNTKPSKSCK